MTDYDILTLTRDQFASAIRYAEQRGRQEVSGILNRYAGLNGHGADALAAVKSLDASGHQHKPAGHPDGGQFTGDGSGEGGGLSEREPLFHGIKAGSRTEQAAIELQRQGQLHRHSETGIWHAGPYNARTAGDVVRAVLGKNKTELEKGIALAKDIANMRRQFPDHKVSPELLAKLDAHMKIAGFTGTLADGSTYVNGEREQVRKSVTWVEGQHPRDKDGEFIKKNEVDEARGDAGKMNALRERVRPEDRHILEEHFKNPGHTGEARAFHPQAQKAGVLRDTGWTRGGDLVEHVGKYLDQIADKGPLDAYEVRDVMQHVGGMVRASRLPELRNILRSMGVKHSMFVGLAKEELQGLIKDKVKAALFDAEVKWHGEQGKLVEGDEHTAREPVVAKSLDLATITSPVQIPDGLPQSLADAAVPADHRGPLLGGDAAVDPDQQVDAAVKVAVDADDVGGGLA